MILLVNETNLKNFRVEPARATIDELKGSDDTYLEKHPDKEEQSLVDFYDGLVNLYGERQSIPLWDYGNDWNEIVYNLGQHVLKCGNCSRKYTYFINNKSFAELERVLKERDKISHSEEKNIFDRLKLKIDLQHLQIGRRSFLDYLPRDVLPWSR